MHLTTKALVLREVNYKEADKILTALPAAVLGGVHPVRVPGALGGEGGSGGASV